MDPEQIYTEVLQEEQQKGSAAPVAEGRAKAARQRAIEGSPHPKEPKWWPGSQPHLEGGGGGDAAAAPEDAADDAAEAAAAEAEPAPEAATPAHTPADAPTPEADASLEGAVRGEDAPVADQVPAAAASSTPAPAPTSAPAAAPAAAAAAAEAPPAGRPAGVTHGTPTGNRLRPEDGVSTEAQFEGQRAMYDRRKLIDEVLATGVSPVSAEEAGRQGSPMLALLYIIIPLLALGFLVAQDDDAASSEAPPPTASASEDAGGGGGAIALTAAGVSFDTQELTIPAGEPATIDFTNDDSLPHNLAFYKSADDGPTHSNPLWTGDEVAAGSSTTYETDPIDKGEYYFQCDIHPSMKGTLTAE